MQPGTRLGHYEILSAIGKGGMGEVYRARDTKLGREVAIKVLPAAFARDSERLARFGREARLLASLNHPNIAAIYGLEESGDIRFLVLELVAGDTLAERVGGRRVPEDEALGIALQIAEGIEAAHEKGVIHRDLKPANVKITPEGQVKVLDFGLAKSFVGDEIDVDLANSPTMSMQATQQGVILGTAAYMSPEQVRGRPLDKRTDVWSFGVVLYEMLTGRRLFAGETMSDIVAGILRAEPDWDEVPFRFRRLLRRCLERDPAKRLRHLGDIDLLLADPRDSVGAVPDERTRRLAPVLMGLVVILTAALAFVGLRGPSAPVMETSRFEIPLRPGVVQSTHFSVSPDGRRVAFRGVSAAGTEIWVRDLGEFSARPLDGTLIANAARLHGALVWSSDSRWIAYWVNGELRQIEADGGGSQKIAEIPGPMNAGFWTEDDVLVFDYPGSDGLWRVSADGGNPERLTQGDHTYASPLPDGEHFLFTEFVDQVGTVYVGSLGAAAAEQTGEELTRDVDAAMYVEAADGDGYLLVLDEGVLTAQRFDPESRERSGDTETLATNVGSAITPSAGGSLRPLGFSAAPDTLVFVTGSEGTQLTWFDREGDILGTVDQPAGWSQVDLSRSGDGLATTKFGETGLDLFIYELAGPTRSRPITFDENVGFLTWSPDASAIAYTLVSGGNEDIYRRQADGTGDAIVLLERPQLDRAGDWSRDGRFLVFVSLETQNTRADIWVLPLADGGEPFPVVVAPSSQESVPALSPDDRWLSFSSGRSGSFEVWIQAFDPTPGVEKPAQAVGSGFVSRWSGDSRELFYMTEPERVLMVAEVTEGPDGNPMVGESRELFDTNAAGFFWDVTPDGQRFIIPVAASAENDSYRVILNWRSVFGE